MIFLLGVVEKLKYKEVVKKFLIFFVDLKIFFEYVNVIGQLLMVKDVKYNLFEFKESVKWKGKKMVF